MKKTLKKMGENLQKRGQVTIFIIIALVILVVLVVFFISQGNIQNVFTTKSPADKLRACLEDPINEILPIIGSQGGSFEPEHYFLYQDIKIEYLCFTEEDYKGCIMQKPLLKQHMEEQILAYLNPRFNDCFQDAKADLEKEGYRVNNKEPKVKVEINYNFIQASAELDLSLQKGESVQAFKTIKLNQNSDLYTMIMISSSILNWEARYGDSETMNYLIFYPHLRIQKIKQDNGVTLYLMESKQTNERLFFASRSYAITSGLIKNPAS